MCNSKKKKWRDNFSQSFNITAFDFVLIVSFLAFQRKVIKWMERTDRILETQSSAIDKILTLLTLQNNQNGQCQMMDDIPKLPLNTLDEMNEFEQYIQESSNFNKMVRFGLLCEITSKIF